MLTLDASLLARQTAMSRKPIIEITAGKLVNEYPFSGNVFPNPDASVQSVSGCLFLSDGRFVVFYNGRHGTATKRELRFVVSNTDATEFNSYVLVDYDLSYSIYDLDAVLMTTGNIGVAVRMNTTSIFLYVVTPAGIKSSEVHITGLNTIKGVTVSQTTTGYALVYTCESAGVYTTYLRTSNDFVTWSSASALTIPTLDNSNELQDADLTMLEDGNYILLYAYATYSSTEAIIYNIQYSISADLSTWGSPVSVTDTTSVTLDYTKPSLIQYSDNSLFVGARRDTTYLRMLTSSDGWQTTDDIGPTNVWVDETNNKLYVSSFRSGAGIKELYGVCRIDLNTWAIDGYYDFGTTPPVPAAFNGISCTSIGSNGIRDGYATVHRHSSDSCAAALINFNNDSINGYYFNDLSLSYGAEAGLNVNHDLLDYWTDTGYLFATDVADGKMWFAFFRGISTHGEIILGYIDISDTSPYDFVTVNTSAREPFNINLQKVYFYPSSNIALIVTTHITTYQVQLEVASLAANAMLKTYKYDDYSGFPIKGVTGAALVGGDTVFAVPYWDTDFAVDIDKWGLMRINLGNDQIDYFYPPWETSPGNTLGNIAVNEDTNELFFRIQNGVAIFNYVTFVWSKLDNSENGGLPPNNLNAYSWAGGLGYYASGDMFVYGDLGHVYLVPRSGTIGECIYMTAASQSSPSFTSPADLVVRTGSINPSIAVDSNDKIYATWIDVNSDTDSIMWDHSGTGMELGPYLHGETAISTSIDAPGRLTFRLSHGHLFDPYNTNSLLRDYIAKGKAITVRLGEEISAVDTFIQQGTFIVKSLRMSHRRDAYPTVEIECEDLTTFWSDQHVTVAAIANRTPEQAIEDIVTDNTALTASNINIPAIDGSFIFDAQWTDQFLSNIIDDIAHRFRCFATMGVDAVLTCRPITNTGTSTRSLTKSEIIELVPNDEYSDLTNRISISGESLGSFEVVFDEERILFKSGTVGWWGFKKDFTLYYSDDKSRRIKNPRLVKLETASSILFALAGEVSEKISYVDPYDKYCVVTITAPNLIPFLIVGIALYLAGNAIGDAVIALFGGFTIPVGRYIEGLGLYIVLNVLASVGNYQYEIYGQPIGYVKHTYTGTVDDEELQAELGFVVASTYEGFLTNTPGQCEEVATFELLIAQLQRRRVLITKTAHLQDEIGDTITVVHPYTGYDMGVYITNITRKYKPGKDGHFVDEMEGWFV